MGDEEREMTDVEEQDLDVGEDADDVIGGRAKSDPDAGGHLA